jgi:HlyD family secretion protein
VALHALPETVAHPETTEVLRKIGVVKRGHRLRRTVLGLVLLSAIAAAVIWWSRRGAAEAAPIWETVTVDRADIEVQVVATGSLEARSVVAVGAEMSGRVASVAVDVNQRVSQGQVLVHLDPETAANTLAESQATLKSSTADLNRSRAALAEAKSVEKRVISLAERGLVSAEEQNTQITSVTLAEADVARSSAQIKLAKIRVDQAKTNLEKLVIVSPIDGIVLSRTVEPGNAIAASLAAPELFTIAEDLARMELHLPVNEADVGRVRDGQLATFRVDAWPDRVFEAKVLEVSFAPVITNNVVTYTAVLEVDNADLALRPGMTATATMIAETKPNALRVPNTALRYTPPVQETKSFSLLGGPPRMRGLGGGKGGKVPPGVWILKDGVPTRVRVTTGTSDGAYTEVDGEIAEGDEVIVAHGKAGAQGAK